MTCVSLCHGKDIRCCPLTGRRRHGDVYRQLTGLKDHSHPTTTLYKEPVQPQTSTPVPAAKYAEPDPGDVFVDCVQPLFAHLTDQEYNRDNDINAKLSAKIKQAHLPLLLRECAGGDP
jgi:hypothetical protein